MKTPTEQRAPPISIVDVGTSPRIGAGMSKTTTATRYVVVAVSQRSCAIKYIPMR